MIANYWTLAVAVLQLVAAAQLLASGSARLAGMNAAIAVSNLIFSTVGKETT